MIIALLGSIRALLVGWRGRSPGKRTALPEERRR
jgi:hypothetical protein